MRFEPDLVLLGGDFVTFNRHIDLMTEVLLTDLRAPDGVRAILGNHDYWAGGDEVRSKMEACGVEFIINRNVRIRRGNSEIALLRVALRQPRNWSHPPATHPLHAGGSHLRIEGGRERRKMMNCEL